MILTSAECNVAAPSTTKSALLFRHLLLTECFSLLSAILRIHRTSIDKCAELILNLLRDMRVVLDISFVGNTCNLGDVGAKHAGPLGISVPLLTSGLFKFSFLGRMALSECHKTPLRSLRHINLEPVRIFGSASTRAIDRDRRPVWFVSFFLLGIASTRVNDRDSRLG